MCPVSRPHALLRSTAHSLPRDLAVLVGTPVDLAERSLRAARPRTGPRDRYTPHGVGRPALKRRQRTQAGGYTRPIEPHAKGMILRREDTRGE